MIRDQIVNECQRWAELHDNKASQKKMGRAQKMTTLEIGLDF